MFVEVMFNVCAVLQCSMCVTSEIQRSCRPSMFVLVMFYNWLWRGVLWFNVRVDDVIKSVSVNIHQVSIHDTNVRPSNLVSVNVYRVSLHPKMSSTCGVLESSVLKLRPSCVCPSTSIESCSRWVLPFNARWGCSQVRVHQRPSFGSQCDVHRVSNFLQFSVCVPTYVKKSRFVFGVLRVQCCGCPWYVECKKMWKGGWNITMLGLLGRGTVLILEGGV